MEPVTPDDIRYIKLGRGGRWAQRGLAHGEVHFGYRMVPHEMCLDEDWEAVAGLLVERGRNPAKAKDGVREIRDFYTLGADCLWITFADGHLWWTFADTEVIWLGTDDDARGARMRKAIDGWRKEDITGVPLRIDDLSTRLTQVAAYRQTICHVRASDYLLRRINAVEEPVVRRAQAAKAEMVEVAVDMIASLHWADFETLVDLIFARTGWQRISRVGGSRKDVDLVVQQPTTGETAFVQVKSRATQAVLEDYVERFRASEGYDRMFLVCHSPRGELRASDGSDIHVWAGKSLAEATVRAGLFDWIIARVA